MFKECHKKLDIYSCKTRLSARKLLTLPSPKMTTLFINIFEGDETIVENRDVKPRLYRSGLCSAV